MKFNCAAMDNDHGWKLTFETGCGGPHPPVPFVRKVVFCRDELDQLHGTPVILTNPDDFIREHPRYVRELYRQMEPWPDVQSGDCICIELDTGEWYCLCAPGGS